MNTDRFVVRAVVCFLGAAVLIGMSLGGYLALDEKNVPDFVVATTSAAVGAMAALLAKTGSEPPAP